MLEKAKGLLASPQEAERVAGVELLSEQNSAASGAMLIGQLETETSPFVRRRIIHLLRESRRIETVQAAVALLSSNQAAVRNAAVEILQGMGILTLPSMAKLASHPDRNLRKLVADILAKIPGESAYQLLAAGLSDADCNVVSASAEALGARREQQAVPLLCEALANTTNVWVAFSLIEALANIGQPAAMGAVTRFISLDWERSEQAALAGIWAYAAIRLGSQSCLAPAWEMYERGYLKKRDMVQLIYCVRERSGGTLDTLAAEPLAEVLADQLNQGEEAVTAAILAAEYCPELLYRFLPDLIERFKRNEEALERITAAVIYMRPSGADLAELLTKSDEAVAKVVLAVAEACSTVLPLPVIEALSAQPELSLAQRAVALAWRLGVGAEAFLRQMAGSHHPELAASALQGLGLLQPEGYLAVILEGLGHPSELVRRQAVDSLLLQPEAALPVDFAGLITSYPQYAWPELLEIMAVREQGQLAAAFRMALSAADNDLRGKMARVCRFIRSQPVFLEVMHTMANDPDQEVRRLAISSLALRSGDEVYQLLTYLYANDKSAMQRYFILGCPEIYRHAETVYWLIENLEQSEPLLKLAAVRGLMRMGQQGRLYLQSLLDVPDGAKNDVTELIRQELKGGVM